MSEPKRYSQLDGVRGFAAVAVVVFHSILDRDPSLNQRIVRPTLQQAHGFEAVLAKLVLILVSGETAVVLFFVLSGAVLFESLKRRHATATATALGFSVRRILRLYPAFLLALLGCLGALSVSGAFSFGVRHFWPNAALYDFSVLGASWTLQVEFLAIPFILVGFWGYQRFGVAGIAGAYALVATLLCAPWLDTHLVFYQRFLSCFALGLLVPTALGQSIARRAPSHSAPLVLVAMLLVRNLLGLHWWSMDAEQILAAVFVALLFHGKGGRLGRIFDSPVSQYLGRLSYSVYLFNIIYLLLVEHWAQGSEVMRRYPLEYGVLLAVPVVAAGILTAHFTERLVERPCIAFGRRVTQFSVQISA